MHTSYYRFEQVHSSFVIACVGLLLGIASAPSTGFGQSNAVSSTEFLQQAGVDQFPQATVEHAFPLNGFPERQKQIVAPEPAPPVEYLLPQANTNDANQAPEPAAYQLPNAGESSLSPSSINPNQTIGSGVANPSASVPASFAGSPEWPSPQNVVSDSPTASATRPAGSTIADRKSQIHTWLGLDSQLPNFLVAYDVMSLRKSGDTAGDFTSGNALERMGRDISGRYTVARLLGTMDQMEFVYSGPFHWDRQMVATGAVDTSLSTGVLPSSSLGALNGADQHHQWHSTSLNSFELNRRWSADDLSNIFGGLRIIDYREDFQLEANKGPSKGRFELSTNNLLVGGQLGTQLGRPLSQRLLASVGVSAGAYFNFASGSVLVNDGTSAIVEQTDDRLRLTTQAQLSANLKYSVTPNTMLFAGYEFWYFPGLSTVADQRLGNILAADPLALRTKDDQLFRGWIAGISAKF